MIRDALELIILLADGVGVAIILIGLVLSLWQLLPVLFRHPGSEEILGIQLVRCRLGSYLVLGLEFMIVSDLIHTVLSRKLDDLYFLAALVLLRTTIGYFLNKEVQDIHAATSAFRTD